ncbi:TetR/AcrR family transcriptional regulator [Solicola sp. PLA-1-18]|uniref:TetR/AcrR family transcriptional regulator n=1 Tax=Solicola sp. PLA-1-18 TaxID=3380532 RepID=UPI003B81ACAB
MTRERPDARAALLAAAREELAEHGHSSIGLRAVARRAGLSHAAPTYVFSDRAGLLTAVATEGFVELTEALRAVPADAEPRLEALGHAYVDFGLHHRALFDLMFRSVELDQTDEALLTAQSESIGVLLEAIDTGDPDESHSLVLTSWALVHGLVVLARDGALGGATDPAVDATDQAHRLVGFFSTLTAR